ncbi:putative Phosphatidylglycerol/phosphatidylinositol transfer protein [Sclerotinia borealis F-4128]|uniref:Phosphatidylglycerol/phosphatidylinositol transfer protein n=1 Tax=Sclerotinia borealis (strain F-4128) TaxID=1432307 RepID=W9CMD8_SCLBF|nr:putative Phosphatidylglycerol/phosphatidylinositol transfer protein [Sclerotinia borealis F-4128]
MKFSISVLTLLFSSSLVAAEGLSLFGNGQKVLDDKGGAVPGINPLTYCKADHSSDILQLDHVNLTPNPPTAGNKLTIEAVGTLSQKLEKGAYVILQVKYGLIRLVNMQQDLCDQVANVDLKCPVDEGKITIVKDVDLPKEIPPGTYSVFADAYTKDGKDHIICLEATITFSR